MNWAMTQNNLGLAYSNLPTGDRAQNLKKAIEANEAVLRVYTEKDFPAQWAATQINLGVAYWKLPTGDRAENLKKAIACYESALKIWTPEAFPNDHKLASDNLNRTRRELEALQVP